MLHSDVNVFYSVYQRADFGGIETVTWQDLICRLALPLSGLLNGETCLYFCLKQKLIIVYPILTSEACGTSVINSSSLLI